MLSLIAMLLLGSLNSCLHGHIYDTQLTTNGNRQELLRELAHRRLASKEFKVLDIGPAIHPWSIQVVDAVVDRIDALRQPFFNDCWGGLSELSVECCKYAMNGCFSEVLTFARCCHTATKEPRDLLRFSADLGDSNQFAELLAHVQEYGKFDFAICTHVLEDLARPQTVLDMLPILAKSGYIAVPSRFKELSFHGDGVSGLRYRGSIHHRWFFSMRNGAFIAFPKVSFIDADSYFDAFADNSEHLAELNFRWADSLPYQVMNGDFLGPDVNSVLDMFRNGVASDDFGKAISAPETLHADDLVASDAVFRSLRAFGFVPQYVLDIGAHMGNWSRMVRTVYPETMLFLIEPNRLMSSTMRDLGKNARRVHGIVVGDEDRDNVTFHTFAPGGVPLASMTGASLFEVNGDMIPPDRTKLESLPMRRLDTLKTQYVWPTFDLVKIDCEGAELEVLSGGYETLSLASFLVIEASTAVPFQGVSHTIPRVTNLLNHMGFVLFKVVHCHEFAPWLQVKCDLLFVREKLLEHYTPRRWSPACVLLPSVDCGSQWP